jgi:hypothetical protein
VNDVANLPPEVAPRGRWVGRGLLLLALAATAWVGWREFDHRAAVREARASGCTWEVREPIAVIRANWRAAFRKDTWTDSYWQLDVGYGRNLTHLRPLLLRLRPTTLIAHSCTDANLDALRGLSGLKNLYLRSCPALQNVDALKGISGLKRLGLRSCTALQDLDALTALTNLQWLDLHCYTAPQDLDALKALTSLQGLDLSGCTVLRDADALKGLTRLQYLYLGSCPALQNVDALKSLTGLKRLDLSDCTALQNVDGLKGLTGLSTIFLNGCPKLPATVEEDLRAALPHISFATDRSD